MGAPATILVVEDMPHIRNSLRIFLQGAGYEVAEAGNPMEARLVLEQKRVDLVLLDVMMPLADGYTFCKALKEDARFKSIPVIFCTAKASREDIAAAISAGGIDYIVKPFTKDIVLAKVAKVLQAVNSARRGTILVVDDDGPTRNIVRYFLTHAGFSVIEARDGLEAVAALAKAPGVNLVLMDIGIPRVDGMTLTQKLREHPKYRTIPIVFCSARGEDEVRNKAAELGAAGYIVKPFTREVFLAEIEKAVASVAGQG